MNNKEYPLKMKADGMNLIIHLPDKNNLKAGFAAKNPKDGKLFLFLSDEEKNLLLMTGNEEIGVKFCEVNNIAKSPNAMFVDFKKEDGSKSIIVIRTDPEEVFLDFREKLELLNAEIIHQA